jgi:hypothetical protein
VVTDIIRFVSAHWLLRIERYIVQHVLAILFFNKKNRREPMYSAGNSSHCAILLLLGAW